MWRAHVLPKGVRDWFECLLAAKHAGLSFDELREEMEWREEAKAHFAWRRAVYAKPRRLRAGRGAGETRRKAMGEDALAEPPKPLWPGVN